MEHEKKNAHRYWWKITNKRQSLVFFIRTILKEQWDLLENKNKIYKKNQGWNQYKKHFIQVWKTEMYCNQQIYKYQKITYLTRWSVISATDEQNFDKCYAVAQSKLKAKI